jgi:hypothetical protein
MCKLKRVEKEIQKASTHECVILEDELQEIQKASTHECVILEDKLHGARFFKLQKLSILKFQ